MFLKIVWWGSCFYFSVLFVFVLCFVCPMLLMSPDCPFFIAPLVFSKTFIYSNLVLFKFLTGGSNDQRYKPTVTTQLTPENGIGATMVVIVW